MQTFLPTAGTWFPSRKQILFLLAAGLLTAPTAYALRGIIRYLGNFRENLAAFVRGDGGPLSPVQNLLGTIVDWVLRNAKSTHALTEVATESVTSRMSRWSFTPPTDAHLERKCMNPHYVDHAIRKNAKMLLKAVVQSVNASARAKGLEEREMFLLQKGFEKAEPGTSRMLDPVDLAEPTAAKGPVAQVLVDVDYYVDMHKVLSNWELTLLYTYVPVSAALTGNARAYFQGDVCHYQSHCGYECTHRLWHYPADYVCVEHRFSTYWYRIKRVSFPSDRQVIVLIPHVKLPWYCWPIAKVFSREGAFLRRRVFQHGPWTAFQVWREQSHGKSRMEVAFCRQGPFSEPQITTIDVASKCADAFPVCEGKRLPHHNAANLTKTQAPFSMQDFAAYLALHKPELDTVHTGRAVTLVQQGPDRKESTLKVERKQVHCLDPVHCDKTTADKSEKIAYLPGDETRLVAKYGGVPKPSVSVVGPDPLLPETNTVKSPFRDRETLEEGVIKRVLEVQEAAKERVRKQKYRVSEHFDAFIQFMLDASYIKKTMQPLTQQAAMQRVPARNRRQMEEAFSVQLDEVKSRVPRAFSKAECYAGSKDPRVITPLAPEVQSKLYPYVYALQDCLHIATFFAFGINPRELAGRVCELARLAQQSKWVLVETDFHRYDGTVTILMRGLEAKIYQTAFNSEEMRRLHKFTYNLRYMVDGKPVYSGGARSSGAPDTCLMNSLLNFFLFYMFYKEIGRPDYAYSHVILGGDDGLAAVPEDKIPLLSELASSCGFLLKCQLRRPGEPFSFLARYFNWDSPNSVCDPARLIPKIHIVPVANVPASQAVARYYQKLTSLIQADGNTPVIGDYLRAELQRITDPKTVAKASKLAKVNTWYQILGWADDGGSACWPNQRESWMEEFIATRAVLNGGKLEVRS